MIIQVDGGKWWEWKVPKVESAKTGWLCNRQNSASEAGMDRSAASSGTVVQLGWLFPYLD
jgi:hypothetical protein